MHRTRGGGKNSPPRFLVFRVAFFIDPASTQSPRERPSHSLSLSLALSSHRYEVDSTGSNRVCPQLRTRWPLNVPNRRRENSIIRPGKSSPVCVSSLRSLYRGRAGRASARARAPGGQDGQRAGHDVAAVDARKYIFYESSLCKAGLITCA